MTTTETTPEHRARLRVYRATQSMPYSGLVRTNPNILDDDVAPEEHFNQIAEWMEALGKVLRKCSEGDEKRSAELYELRDQRAAIRNFLGL